ncbi:exodeoxyribonuclease VII large subunit [Peptoniphilus sp. KCTC 25270]|uniref:exodeoxyribonuclease VII large subunit n=1 Tax=Peptoniphilus sp. KCTC 25270 TaxID=2897414 RepID=UPI001E2D09EE|nr:exodeoxyribonuclease VII large subunit [Peptoniphilus sp. KCTC 25270]MCD1147148.1 exodeoxyribonuclease VII large subunit [Peptoniphilus sp. KCTC 25270]
MNPLKVSELNQYINKILKMDYLLQAVIVEGEISQAKKYPSGHLYLTLKDEESQISGIMYKWNCESLDFEPKQGMSVLIKGQIQCYTQGGKLQLVISEMTVAGEGILHLRFLELKKKLEKEGLFDLEKKKEIPKYPQKIGVVTSLEAAALADFLRIANRRNPMVDLLISPSLVQGETAHIHLIQALKKLDVREDIDLIVITRGGGSLEDLWAFNEEELVRAISTLSHPVVSAVGHEVDFTLTDFVADLRASTPSAAAEIVIPDKLQWIQKLDSLLNQMDLELNRAMDSKVQDLERFFVQMDRLVSKDSFALNRWEIENIKKDLDLGIESQIYKKRENLTVDFHRLNPRNILHKITKDKWEAREWKQKVERILQKDLEKKRMDLENLFQSLEESALHLQYHKIFKADKDLVCSVSDFEKEDVFTIEFYDGWIEGVVKEIRERGAE